MTDAASPLRLLPCGDRAIMAELADAEQRRALDALLRRDPLPGVVEHVPAAVTVLVRLDSPERMGPTAQALRELAPALLEPSTQASTAPGAEAGEAPTEIPVRYDGEDLAAVAEQLGIDTTEVVRRHTAQLWTVEFAGFMPGFGYLAGDEGGLEVRRRDDPRTRIPAGSVGLAGAWTGIYPQASPGGWQLIGSCRATLWDVHRDPPAILAPGTRIRFVDEADAASTDDGEGR